MELRHLHYFIAVAEELNFSRAAERLHIAQPPLSHQIRQLEIELGFQLFHRTKRKVELTASGLVFFRDVQNILQQLEQAIQRGQQTSRGEVGHLMIGFVSSAAHNILPEILQAFRQDCPNVTLELRELTTNQQLDWLQERRIDIGFVRPPIEEDRFNGEIIFQEPLMIALPERHPLRHEKTLALRSLSQESFILFPRALAPGLYDPILHLCQQAGFNPTVTQEAIQMQTIISLVAAEMGIAIVPASMENLQRRGVIYKSLQDITPMVAIALIWRQKPSPVVEKFLAVAKAVTSCILQSK